jgi:nicotinate-nucleotide pyrophosphorylase (carboxylating)
MSGFSPAETAACCRLIEMAFHEDFGETPWPPLRDPTTASCCPPGYFDGAATFVVRQQGIAAGLPAAALVCGTFDPQLQFEFVHQDGEPAKAGDALARVRGSMSAILAIERTALNFLQHLSGIATLTRQFVQAVAGLPVKILDTRKTLPGWRMLAKYAVRQGGGQNHRMGLFDAVLIKDNHMKFAVTTNARAGFPFDIGDMVRLAGKSRMTIEVEVESLPQLDLVLVAGPDIVLLDNMPLDMMREAVKRRNTVAPNILLEASGGVNLQTVRGIAETGVDRISVGALTHSAPALDIALDYES